MTTFGARLHALSTPARPALCRDRPPRRAAGRSWGLDHDVTGLERFALTAAEALAPRVAVVKPQSAFYERFGSRGIAVLERVVTTCRDGGALVLLDVKRGDIGSTTQAYADAYLDPASPIAVDAITASPYLGVGSLDPMVETARTHGTGVFVLALTSNPEGPEVQEARSRRDGPWPTWCSTTCATSTPGPPRSGPSERSSAPPSTPAGTTWPSTGRSSPRGTARKGGTDDDLRRVFGASIGQVLPSTSRELLSAGPDGLADAADRLNDRLRVLRG